MLSALCLLQEPLALPSAFAFMHTPLWLCLALTVIEHGPLGLLLRGAFFF